MFNPQIAPTPVEAQAFPQQERVGDDILLPDWPNDALASERPNDRFAISMAGFQGLKGISKALATLGVLAAISAGGWFYSQSGIEKQHDNWQFVAAATDASSDTVQQLIHVDASGSAQSTSLLTLTRTELNRRTTQDVQSALKKDDLVTATAFLQAAQRIPTAAENPDVRPPVLRADLAMTAAIRDGRSELFQIELYDCCAEDGDIVEISVNGEHFATVPIMHAASLVSIPLQRGQNTVTVRAVNDGGGGVTLSLRTSRGDYFARYMYVGETHQMGVIVQ